MVSKGLKLLLLFMLPLALFGQGVAFRKADTVLVTSDNGQLRIWKSQPYYSSLFALKVAYSDTLTKIATKSQLLLGFEPKFSILSVSKGGTGRSTLTSGALFKGNATGAIVDAIAGTDYVIPSALSAYALNSNVVHLTGNETIAGIKTFTSNMFITGEWSLRRVSQDQRTNISNESGATSITSKNNVSSTFLQMVFNQGNNTTDREVARFDVNGKFNLAFGGTSITAPPGTNSTEIATTAFVAASQTQIVDVAGTTQVLAPGNTYIFHNASTAITASLPITNPTSNGGLITIIVDGAGRVKITQNANQFIVSGSATSTVGTSGFIQTSTNNATITLRYVNTNKWLVSSSNSTPTIN